MTDPQTTNDRLPPADGFGITPLGGLADNHRRMLCEESGITAELIQQRGYRTIFNCSELSKLGFSSNQQRVPGLLIPIHCTDSSRPFYQYRPDSARQKRGKKGNPLPDVVKYEIPAGTPMRLDVPPVCLLGLKDPSVALWITEGIKKADALASRGVCAIALLGVWNFKGKNLVGGVTLLADFDHIALNGRDVRIVFDSDIVDKPSVRQAMERLREHLQRKGAYVGTVYLPGGREQKVGVDDYLTVHSIEELGCLVSAPRPVPSPAPATYTLLDEMPVALRRPLQIINGRAYAVTWLPVLKIETETLDRDGNVIKLIPQRERTSQELFVIRDDGKVFGDAGDQPLKELKFEVALSEIPQESRLMKSRVVRAYRAGQRVKPIELFGRIVETLGRFIDFDRSLANQSTMSELIACYTLATWFLDAFNVAGYIWPTGERGSGKTHLLTLICEMAYLGQVILASGTMATLRDFADYGAFLGFDDAENLASSKQSDPDKRALLLAGNRRGSTISLKEIIPGQKAWRTRHVQTFSFRGFTATQTPDPILSSRTITVPLVRTGDRHKANADVMDFELWPFNRDTIVSDLWSLSLANLVRMRDYDRAVAERAALSGRDLEPWRALLSVALWLQEEGLAGIFDRLDALSCAYQRERHQFEAGDLTAIILRAVAHSIVPQSDDEIDLAAIRLVRGPSRLSIQAITEAAKHLVDVEQLEVDPGEIKPRTVGPILAKLRFNKVKIGSNSKTRGWEISSEELIRLLKSFGLATNANEEIVMSPMSSSPPDESVQRGHEDIQDVDDLLEFYEGAQVQEYDGGLSMLEAEY